MPASYPVTVYFYTGFNTGNVPAEASILESAQHRDYDAVFKFQSRDNAVIRLNAEWAEIKDADYLKLSVAGDLPVYYVVTQVVMLSARTAELSLVMDPLLSCGGLSAISVIDGWEIRSHVGTSEDGLFDNILPEPWKPMNVLELKGDPQIIHELEDQGSQFVFVGATVDLNDVIEYKASVYSAAENPDASVVVPKLPSINSLKQTKVGLLNYEYSLPNVGIYNLYWSKSNPGASATTVEQMVAATREIGVDSALTSSYLIPSADVIVELNPEVGRVNPYKKIQGAVHEYTAASNYQYGTVKNKKAIALYNTYALMSLSSASYAEFEAAEIYNNDSSPKFRVLIDPIPGGTAYAQPMYYEGKAVKFIEHSVAGLPWLNSGLMLEGASGGGLSVLNAGRANKLIDYERNNTLTMLGVDREEQAAKGIVTGAAVGVGLAATAGLAVVATGGAAAPGIAALAGAAGVGGAATATGAGAATAAAVGAGAAGAGALHNATNFGKIGREYDRINAREDLANYSADFQMGDNMFTAQVAANVQSPEIRFPVAYSMAAYVGNSFYIYHIGLSANDLARFDKFLTMFGYTVDRPLDKKHMNNRKRFNYIKTADSHFKAPAVSSTMLSHLSSMMNRGIRIWHELPNASAFNDNPAKEGT